MPLQRHTLMQNEILRCRKYGASRWGGMVASAVSRGKKPVDTVVGELTEDTALEEAQFRDLLEKIDRGLRALPATAQARQGIGIGLGTLESQFPKL